MSDREQFIARDPIGIYAGLFGFSCLACHAELVEPDGGFDPGWLAEVWRFIDAHGDGRCCHEDAPGRAWEAAMGFATADSEEAFWEAIGNAGVGAKQGTAADEGLTEGDLVWTR